jgi:hypothetical protein
MTSCPATGKARRETVALTRSQVERIIYDMGWEPEDADAFWRLATRQALTNGGRP